MSEFLLELFSEEIPARMQKGAREQLERLFISGLDKAHLNYDKVQCFSTPRRLTLVAQGIPEEEAERWEEVKGPMSSAPEKAVEGFLRRCGINRDECEERKIGSKGPFLFARVKQGGRPSSEILTTLVEEILAQFVWPKSMRWGSSSFTWVRPLHSILPLFAGQALPVKPPHPGVSVGNTTRGHRFLAPDSFVVKNFTMYEEQLAQAYVVLDQDKRSQLIRDGLAREAKGKNGEIPMYPGLIEEVTGLVEWPVVLSGTIDKQFMHLPKEVLVTTMRHHQRYFPLVNAEGNLEPYFFFVSNMAATDGGKIIIQGNERVLQARLQDAKFHWKQDLSADLIQWNEKLKLQLYHADLGTMWEKVERLMRLMPLMPGGVEGGEVAAQYAKADLASGMVGEFPELQGIMGGYYAHNLGLPKEIAHAIRTQYLPQGPDDPCPLEPLSVALSLADKWDALVGFFGVDRAPSGSKDPFALRRSAIGIIRLVEENSVSLPLADLLKKTYPLYHSLKLPESEVEDRLLTFMRDRLKFYLKSKGIRHDYIEAALSDFMQHGNILQSLDLAEAISVLMQTAEGKEIVQIVKRLGNIMKGQIAVKNGSQGVDPSLFRESSEKVFWENSQALINSLSSFQWQVKGDYSPIWEKIHGCTASTNAFFEQVQVNAPEKELARNRQAIVFQLLYSIQEIADLGVIDT